MPIPPSAVVSVVLRASDFSERLLLMPLVIGVCLLIAPTPTWSQDGDMLRPMENAPVDEARSAGNGDWRVTLGAGVGIRPESEGSDDLTASPIPLVDISWRDRVFLNVRHGLGAYVVRTQRFRLGLSLGYGAALATSTPRRAPI